MSTNKFSSTKTDVLEGAGILESPPEQYKAVDCHFTDELEFLSIKKILVEIKYWLNSSDHKIATGTVTDIFTKNKEEYLVLSDSTQIRLDKIMQIRIL